MSDMPYFAGIDVAKAQLDIALRPSGERWSVPHDPNGVTMLVERMQTLQPTLIVLQTTRRHGGSGVSGVPSATPGPHRTLMRTPFVTKQTPPLSGFFVIFFRLRGPGAISIRCPVLTGLLCTAANAVWQHQTHEVGQKRPNAWGLYDMLGNVYEWCYDGRREYTETAAVDPVEPAESSAGRAIRGGGWVLVARLVRAAVGLAYDPDRRSVDPGFRCSSSGRSSK